MFPWYTTGIAMLTVVVLIVYIRSGLSKAMWSFAITATVLPVVYFMMRVLSENWVIWEIPSHYVNFLDGTMANWLATILGIVAGIPIALWINRSQQNHEARIGRLEGEIETIQRGTQVIIAIEEELKKNQKIILSIHDEQKKIIDISDVSDTDCEIGPFQQIQACSFYIPPE